MILKKMKTSKKRVYFYISAYLFIASFAIVGLMVNIKTVPLNNNIQKLSKKIKKKQEENRYLLFELSKKTALRLIDKKTTAELEMGYPKKIHYLNE